MRFVFVLVLILCAMPARARERFSLSQRVTLSERAPKQASSVPSEHAWKLGLLGLAALSFLIRKRL
jgi:hypothetical protein